MVHFPWRLVPGWHWSVTSPLTDAIHFLLLCPLHFCIDSFQPLPILLSKSHQLPWQRLCRELESLYSLITWPPRREGKSQDEDELPWTEAEIGTLLLNPLPPLQVGFTPKTPPVPTMNSQHSLASVEHFAALSCPWPGCATTENPRP